MYQKKSADFGLLIFLLGGLKLKKGRKFHPRPKHYFIFISPRRAGVTFCQRSKSNQKGTDYSLISSFIFEKTIF